MPKHFFADHEPNTSGRDFAVGDLHGCRAMLDTLLAHAAFDRQKDRLFSVGDLVDRGPDSMGCLALIGEPWFFPVLGNHDAMLLAWLMDQQGLNPGWLRYYVEPYLNPRNGGSWAQTVPHGARRNLIAELRTLPLARRAGRGGEQEFWVAHAEVFDQVSGEGLQERLHMDTPDIPDRKHYIGGFGGKGGWRDHLLWGRSLYSTARYYYALGSGTMPPEHHPGIPTTYVGHSILPPVSGPEGNSLLRMQSHVFLDGGAFYGCASGDTRYGLTLWCHTENRGWMVGGNGQIREVS